MQPNRSSLSLSGSSSTLDSDEKSIRLTSHTDADEISSASNTAAHTVPKWRRWLSFAVLYLTVMDASSGYSAMTTSMFPYLLQLTDGKAPTTLLGLTIAGYSIGAFAMAPILGFWSDRRSIKEPLIACFLASFVANIAYGYASALPTGGQYLVLVTRIVIGGCAAISAVVKSYIAYATTETERSLGLAGVSASQTVGILAGPLLALVFVPLGSKGIYIPAIRFHFNMFTGPSYVSAVLDIINIILIVVVFREYRINSKKKKTFCAKSDKKGVDWLVVIGTLIISFLIYLTFAVYSAMLVPYSMDEFAWNKQQAILYNSIIFSSFALLATVSYIIVGLIIKWVELRLVLMIGCFILGTSFLILIPMSNQYPKIMGAVQSSSAVGCRINQLKWCQQIPQLLIPQYVVGIAMMTIGYASTMLPSLTLYSRILGPYPQGVLMGVSTSINSLSLAVGPPIVTLLYDRTGPQITLATVIGVVVVIIVIVMVFCHRMVPYGQKHSL